MKAKDAIKQIREEDQPPTEAPVETAAASAPPAAEPAAAAAPPAAEGVWEPWMDQLLMYARTKFVGERVKGFTHPQSGQTFAPVSPEEAEARWLKAEPKFKAIIQSDPDIRAKYAPTATSTPPAEKPTLSGEPPAGVPEAPPTD